MVDRLGFDVGIVFLEEIGLRRVQLIENSPAGRNTGQSIDGPGDAGQRSRTRQAQQAGNEQSSIHENLYIRRPSAKPSVAEAEHASLCRTR
jgi:hypothetical protein